MASLMQTVKWISDARAEKELGPGMSFYKVQAREIRATNGKLTAGCPWDNEAEFVVSGGEFEKILARMNEDNPSILVDTEKHNIIIRSGRLQGTVATLPINDWVYPGVDDAKWVPIPSDLIDVLRSLRAFVPDNPSQPWIGCIALDHGNCYATNNICVAGRACDVGDIKALLPSYAVDFILRRVEGLVEWSWSENYVGFRWSDGKWVRSQLVIGSFPERAAELIREAYSLEPTQEITDDFREAFGHVAGLAEDTIKIFADRMESKFKRSVVVASCECETPPGNPPPAPALEPPKASGKKKKAVEPTPEVVDTTTCSIWGAQFLAPVISQATHWQPSMWPKPAPFRGANVAGFIVGRKEA